MGCFNFDCEWVIWVILILAIRTILSNCCDDGCGCGRGRNNDGCGC